MASRLEKRFEGGAGEIVVERNEHGIPEISAGSYEDAVRGLGWIHARDRQLQMLLTRILLQGRASELLAADAELLAVDRFMRKMKFEVDAAAEVARLEPTDRALVEAYADGVNQGLRDGGTVFELKLLGVRPEPWRPVDSMVLAKMMGFLGLADAQGNMEKLIVQLVQQGVDEARLKELFPYLTERVDVALLEKVKLAPPVVPEVAKWLRVVPRMTASNNWAVAGSMTALGQPILCNDPHLEVNRIPAIWYEAVLRIAGRSVQGASLPGAPVLAIGRSPDVAWGVTFSFMDMIDFRVEHCRDGCYRRGEQWVPFLVREERILLKKGGELVERFFENEHGILEGDPWVEGHYLVQSWSAAKGSGAGDFAGMLGVPFASEVTQALACFRKLEALPFNWVAADAAGNIGYQMSGRMWRRGEGVSGLVPRPGWDSAANPQGFVDPQELPSRYNPPEGYIVTANDDLNGFGKAKPINLPMASYRAERIAAMLEERRGKLDSEWMKTMHFDLLSLQAVRLMALIGPLLPEADANAALLREWDCRYEPGSKGATVFESIYLALLEVVFGEHGFGRDVVRHLMRETVLFNDYYGQFDAVLMRAESAWYQGSSREALFRRAIAEGLAKAVVPYGETRKVTLVHLLFGGKLPLLFGFDRGPYSLPGSRATIPQGQIFRSGGRASTISPSYRMIADFSRDGIETTLPGGPSDRRFSRYYLSDFQNWLRGRYKRLK